MVYLPTMKRLLFAIFFILPSILPAQDCQQGRTALVLSGGGVKGLAHIGVLRILDSLGVRPDLVVGTSMGAAVGALYASGYTAAQIDSVARLMPFGRAFRKYRPLAPRPFAVLHPALLWEQRRTGFELQQGTVSESEIGAMLNRSLLRGNLEARGNFDSLPIPYRAVATDLRDRGTVVLASGDLAEAVRASMSLPLILQPVVLGDSILVDGGLSANIPVAVARGLGATRVIVSDVSGSNPDSLELSSPLGTVNRLLDFLFLQSPPTRDSGDVYVRPDVIRFRSLDFSPATVDSVIRLGNEAASAAFAAPSCRFGNTAPRAIGLPSRIDTIAWSGARPADHRFLARTLSLSRGGVLDTAAIAKGFAALAAGDRYRALWLGPTGNGDQLDLGVRIGSAPRRIAGAGLAYSSDVGGRVWLGVLDRNLAGSSIQGSAALVAGQIRQELQFDTRLLGIKPQSMVPLLALRVAHESVRFFNNDSARGAGQFSQTVNEADGVLAVEQGFGGGWFAELGPYGHIWHESPRSDHIAGGLRLRLGTGAHPDEPGFSSEVAWTSAYTRIAAAGIARVTAGRFRFGAGARFGWGRDLPPQLTFPLGGSEGFPGMHYAELRGDREAMALVFIDHPLIRPVSVYAQGAAGQSGTGGDPIPMGRWWVGGRIGLAVDSPIGPIRVDYGVTRDWRDLVTVRVGHTF